jgi:hypothetical protein
MPPGSANTLQTAATFTLSPNVALSMIMSPIDADAKLIRSADGKFLLRQSCRAELGSTRSASTTLANSTSTPSLVVFTIHGVR